MSDAASRVFTEYEKNQAAEIERLTADLAIWEGTAGQLDKKLQRLTADRDAAVALTNGLAAEIERLQVEWTDAEIDWQKREAKLQARVERLEGKINSAINVGHNDDCMFCGFKDKALGLTLTATEQEE